jgi:mycothiol S-conjugate amidase
VTSSDRAPKDGRRLLFVHAHPDDESSKGAATAARYADEGAEVVLVTCTGGEAGEVLNPACDAIAPERMAEVRAAELEAAADAIGFARVHRLGYVDSGWTEDLAVVPKGTFWHIPLAESGAALARVIRRERPHVVVTYPEDGGYPHPDHIRTHAVTIAASALAEDPDADLRGPDDPPDRADAGAPWRVPKLYASTGFPAERLLALHDALDAAGIDSPFQRRLDDRPELLEGPPPHTRIRCDAWFARRDAALLAHVTQVDPDGNWFRVPRDLERTTYPFEAYDLLRSDVEVAADEDDLFTGLDTDENDRGGGDGGSVDAGQTPTGGVITDAR